MTSILEKFKKGIKIEEPVLDSKEKEEKEEKLDSPEKPKTDKSNTIKVEKIARPRKKPQPKEKTEEKKEDDIRVKKEGWFQSEGQLAVDVYQTENELVIQSAIAGVRPEELNIVTQGDVIIIKGKREKPAKENEINYFCQECYWGSFSREIILPVEADAGRAKATMREGVLTIRMPKIEREKEKKIAVKPR